MAGGELFVARSEAQVHRYLTSTLRQDLGAYASADTRFVVRWFD